MWPLRPAIAAALAMTIAAPTLGAEPPAKPPETAGQPANDAPPKEKLICTREAVTGSVMTKRVCRTPQQIDADRKASEDVKKMRGQGGTFSGDRPSTVR